MGLSAAGAAPYVQAFDSLLAGPVAEYLKISKEIGGDVQKHVRMFGPFSPLLKGLMASSNPNHPWFKSPLQGSWLLSSQLLPIEFSQGTGTVPQIFLGPLLLSRNLFGLLLYR